MGEVGAAVRQPMASLRIRKAGGREPRRFTASDLQGAGPDDAGSRRTAPPRVRCVQHAAQIFLTWTGCPETPIRPCARFPD